MPRNPRKAAFCREVGGTLMAEGFQEQAGRLAWSLRSDLGDYVAVDVQSSRSSANVVYVNIAVVPGPNFDWIRWLDPYYDMGDAPGPEIGYLHERVRPVEAPWDWDLALHTLERARQLGAFVARDLAKPFVPRFRRYLDRDVLLATLDGMSAMAGAASWLRAAFLAETGDAESADRTYGPADEDDENQARQRRFLHEFAVAHQMK